ncbi:MAG: PAS domain-containing protein [Myxococcales bacterium]|nr:PAS domain-containing protein [Myxococcales bacterium]
MGAVGIEEARDAADGTRSTPATRVYVVEDEVVVAKELQRRLRTMGFEPCGHSTTGETALLRIPEARPDLVLMDVDLGPGATSGLEVARALRSLIEVPVVFLAATASPDDVAAGLEAGASALVEKLVEPEVLRASIERALARRGAVRGAGRRSHPEARECATEIMERDEHQGPWLALEGSRIGSWEWDPQTEHVRCDARWARVLGLQPQELPTTLEGHRRLVHPEDRAQWDAVMEAHLRGRTPGFDTVHRMRHADGGWRLVLGRGRVLGPEESGRARRFHGILMDVTAAKEAERVAVEASRAKARLLASTSHELRTPLNAVLGLSGALLDGSLGRLDPKQARAVRIIRDGGRELLAMITDLIDIARLEEGEPTTRRGPAALGALVEECVRIVRPAARAKRQRIVVELGSAPITVGADAQRLEKILAGLLSNATRIGPPGTDIEVGATVRPDAGRLELWVASRGSPIVDEDRERLSRSAASLRAELDHAPSGPGSGLSLVQHIVERRGGALRVELLDDGARVLVSLPWTPDAAPARAAGNRLGDAGPRGERDA